MPRLASLAKVIFPGCIAVTLCTFRKFLGEWAFVGGFFFGFVAAVWIAVEFAGGRVRDAATLVASVLLCLAAINAYAVIKLGPTTTRFSASWTSLDNVLGWVPKAGTYHETKFDPRTGKVTADAHITIEPRGIRKTISAEAGPTVVFFGDSMTFGDGVSDFETLPQSFADVSGRRLHVLNLAVAAYGPQQFLRALEKDVYKDILQRPRLLVYLTSQWHAERTSCMREFVFLAPRYKLVDGRPVFQGPCHGLIYALLARSAIYRAFVESTLAQITQADIDLYVSILARAAEVARKKYAAPTVILYLPDPLYARQSGFADQQVMQLMRASGLKVIDVALDQNDFPGQPLAIPGDGHPTGIANAARATMLYAAFDQLMGSTASLDSVSAAAQTR